MKANRFTKVLAWLLCLCMCVSMLPSRFATAEENPETTEPQSDMPEVIVTQNGEIAPDEDWNEAYPTGTFAFENYQADIAEPGAVTADGQALPQSILIPVYRFGGTVGKAIVHFRYTPAVTMDENGEEYVYDYAASGKQDLLIEIEDPNPIAEYQPLGIPEKEQDMAPSEIRITLPELPEEVAETDPVDLILSEDAAADAYRWQCNDGNGWQDIAGAETDTLALIWSDLWDFEADAWTGLDFRCIYETDGALFCTASLLGEAYVSAFTEPEPVPEDLVIPDEPGFTALSFENDYDECEFDLVFADGETVKYIRVTALDDEIPELPEMGLFTIVSCEGGAMSDTCSTLMLMISDNDVQEPSALGFAEETVSADRAEGMAKVKIARTGGKTYPVTVHYTTEDGTALAGIDYAKTEGELAFSGSIDEIEIAVPLITRFTTEEKSFSIVLDDVRGGGTEDICSLSVDRTEVTIIGRASDSDDSGEGQNLATLLTQGNGTDVSANVARGKDALVSIETEPSLVGDVIMPEPASVKAAFASASTTRLYSLPGHYYFTRDSITVAEQSNDGTTYWRDWDDILGDAGNCYSDLDHARTANSPISISFTPDGGEDPNKIHYSVNSGIRDYGGQYYVTPVDTNYRGNAETSWNLPNAAGDYYDRVLMSFGWVSVGFRKTNKLEYRHRYLRPHIGVSVGSWYGSRFFYPNTNSDRTHWKPDDWQTYLRLRGRGDWDFTSGTSYNHSFGYDAPDGPDLDFGENIKISLSFQFYDTWTADKSWTYDSAVTEDGYASLFDIRVVSGRRRVFRTTNQNAKGISLNLYTANDASENNGFTVIEDGSSLYNTLAPDVSLVPGAGGVDKDGNIYVGSTLRVTPSKQVDNFAVSDGGIYMINSKGEKVGNVTQNSDGTWDIEMIWWGINGSDLDEEYTLCAFYNRKQKLEIDITHSVPHDADGNISEDDVADVWSRLLACGVTLKTSEMNGSSGEQSFSTSEIRFDQSSMDAFTETDPGVFVTKAPIDNIQTVCFNEDPADVIVHAGTGYAGNASMPLDTGDFTLDALKFDFYDADFLDVVSPMTVSIDHVDVFYDKNGDGKISGDLDEYNIFQIAIDPDTGEETDTFVDRITGDYPDSSFAPVLDDDGVTHQYFFLVYLTTGPRSLIAPPGYTGDGKAQLLPAFISAVTDPLEAAKETEEQRMNRYLHGNRLDDFPMFGAETSKIRIIEIPLGGDIGTITSSSVTNGIFDDDGNLVDAKTETTFTWEPNYVGNLLVPFDSPTEIVNTNNVTGGEVVFTGDNLNSLLGSFVGRSGFVVGIQEQIHPIDAPEGTIALSGYPEIKPETIEMGPVRSVPDANNMANTESAEDPGETEGAGPQNNKDTNDFQQDLGSKLPGLQLGIGDYATIIMDGYTVGFSISIPVLSKEKTLSEETEETLADGTKKKSYTDEEGLHEEYQYATNDNSTVNASVVTKVDPNNPNKRTKTIVTETKSLDGKTSYQREVREQIKDASGNWVGSKKTKTNDKPSLKQSLKENAAKTTGINTLSDFCNACKSNDQGSLKNFMSGQFLGDSFRNAKNGKATTKGRSATFSVQFAIMFEYNPIDNCHYFKSAGASVALGLNFTLQARFTPFPLLYLYLKLGLEIKASAGFTCYRIADYGDEIKTFESGGYEDLMQGGELVFKLDMKNNSKKYRGFVINLKGKVLMQVYDNAAMTGDPAASGTLSGDGGEREVLLKAYDKDVYVKLTPGEGASHVVSSKLRPIKGAQSKVAFDGLTIEPSLSAEFGAGIGVELLKFEVYIKVSTSIALTMGGYLKETDTYEGFYVSDFKATASVGMNISLLFINFSLDAITIGSEGKQHGTGGWFDWDSKLTALNGNETIQEWKTYTAANGKNLGTTEPQVPSSGVNIFKDNTDIRFFKSNGDPVDVSDGAPTDQGWTFRTGVLPWRWKGGDFLGETPQNSDLAEADEDDVFILFAPEESKIALYFSGKIRVFVGSDTTGTEYKDSPAVIDVGDQAVKVLLKKGAKLDRYEDGTNRETNAVGESVRKGKNGLVHISGPTDITGTQKVITPDSDTRAITPLGTDDFQLSGYNTSGDAKELVKGLVTGYDYLLVKAGEENYIFYPLMLEPDASGDDAEDAGPVPQLVVSKLVMTGDLEQSTGLVHPITDGTDPAYLIVDNDSYTDLTFDAVESDGDLFVSWVTHADTNGDTYAVKQRRIPLSPDAETPEIETLYSGSDPCTLPVAENGSTVWVSADGDGSADNAKLKAWLIAQNEGLTEDILDNPDQSYDRMLSTAVFQWVTLSAMNTLYGDSSVLNVKIGDAVMTDTITGEHVHNIETATIDNQIYLLYSTSQTAYLDTTLDVPTTVGSSDIDRGTEKTSIHRLYLRTVNSSGFSPAVCIQSVVDYDSCTSNTMDSSRLKDGVYIGGALDAEQADPYYANLRFVSADIDGSGTQTMALFEMGGNTWLLNRADMDALLSGGSSSVALTPIFSEPAGTDVAIGSDGNNLAIVYTAPIDNSLSNAIYISWWDRNEAHWGSPTILAMRGLQIYEDRITYDMTPEDAESAYLGLVNTPGGATGSMDKLVFSNLQMSTAKITHDEVEHEQLIILTTGALTQLKQLSNNDASGAREDIAPDGAASIGFYAIGFGMGEQTVGEGDLDFSNSDFSGGSRLIGEVSFRNTGTAAIRASEANPLTVRLMVTVGAENSQEQELATWKLIKSIPCGTQTKLLFKSLPLVKNLQEGATFYLDIEEDAYFTDNYHGTLDDLFVVGNAPELSFSNFDLELSEVKDGIATFVLDATVVNNGSANASEVFIQFSYDTGETDEYGNRIYNPIDITGSKLETGVHTSLRNVRMQEDYTNGIYKLNGPDGTNIDIGYGRTVSGTLCVPTGSFVSLEEVSGLHIKAEIYSDADTPNYRYGVYSSDHGEYNESNNRFEQTVKHHTAFTVPDRITTALGTTLVLPVSFHSTGDTPNLMLTEISDGTSDWSPNMGVCYYDAERKVIVAAPNSKAQAMVEQGETPTGILQLKDTDTNTIEHITYRIGSMAQGVNIFRDDASFTFYDANGDETILYPSETDQPGWSFLNKGVSIGWTGGAPNETPMNHDLSLANQDGAYFTFESVADTMEFYFMGEITVESSLFGTQTFTTSPSTFTFDNPTGAIHIVKVTAKAGTKIDRYVATYKDDPVVDPDPDAPQALWNRSFPDVASIQEGDSLTMTCYITDHSGVSNVLFDDLKLTETTTPALQKCSDNLWYFDYTFTGNDVHRLRVTDIVGNTAESTIYAEWFNSVVSTGANADAPALVRDHLGATDPDGNPVGMRDPKNYTPWLKSAYELRSDEQSKALVYADGLFSDTPLDKSEDERWLIAEDGIYQVRVDREDGTWARAIVLIEGIDLIPPELTVNAQENQLRIHATDNCSLASVTVNGYPLTVSGRVFRGFFPVAYGGDYTVCAADAAGNVTEQTVHVDVPLKLNDHGGTIYCANGDIHGEIIVNRSYVSGGSYDPTISHPEQNAYTTNLEIAIASEGTTEAPEIGWVAMNDACTLIVPQGVYELFVRNSAGETAKYANSIYLYHPMSWGAPTYEWNETETGYTATATSVCALNATHITSETVEATGVVTLEPTCATDGEEVFTAVFENELFTTQKLFVTLPQLGHIWSEPTYNWFCDDEFGWVAEASTTCERDTDHVVTERVVAADEVITPPTCEEEGEMLYTGTFEVEMFEAQTMTQPIPPMGHDWGEPTYEWVENETGYTVTGTTVCRHDPTHIGVESVETTYEVVTPPTTRADGVGRYTAVFTDERFTTQMKDVVLPMLQPTFCGEHVLATDVAEYTEDGTLYRYDVTIKNVDVDRQAVSMQVSIGYDPSVLTFVNAETIFTGNVGVHVENGTIRYAWATESETLPLPDGTVILSLYFKLAAPVSNGTVAALAFGDETGFAYLDDSGKPVEADPVLYEDGSITFSIPDTITIKGEDVFANDVMIREDGELLYRYDLRVCDLPKHGLLVNSAQIFLAYDNTKLVLRKAEGAVDWTMTDRHGKLLCAWASETGVMLKNDDIVLTLWFAKGENVRPGDRVDITFTMNSLWQKSSLSFLFADKVTDVEVITIDGSITFEAIVYGDANCDGTVTAADAALILRALVGLSELTPRGMLNGDVDGDGEITAEDAAMILRCVVKLIDSFPAENP